MLGLGLTIVIIGGLGAIASGLLRGDGVGAGLGAALLGIGLILTALADAVVSGQDAGDKPA